MRAEARTYEMCEVHIQPLAAAKVGVHPAAMQDHLGHTLLQDLVVLRSGGDGDGGAEQLDSSLSRMSDTHSPGLIKHK